MGIREEHRVRMLRDIQHAALDLVEEQGLEATTVGDIADRVGVSERTVFRYYPSKEHALMPGQQGLVNALVACETGHHTPSGILVDLLTVCREHFSHEVEQRDFRRISRLMIQEPEMLRVVMRQERHLVEALSSALLHRSVLDGLQSLLVAEVVTASWRVAWQSFARDEYDGVASDPVALFDQTVRELGQLFPNP